MLRSFAHLRGLPIHASDGEIGSLRDVYFDDQSTLIRYFVVTPGIVAFAFAQRLFFKGLMEGVLKA